MTEHGGGAVCRPLWKAGKYAGWNQLRRLIMGSFNKRASRIHRRSSFTAILAAVEPGNVAELLHRVEKARNLMSRTNARGRHVARRIVNEALGAYQSIHNRTVPGTAAASAGD